MCFLIGFGSENGNLTNLTKKWAIIELQALCPECDVELIDDSVGMTQYELARCPQCKQVYGGEIESTLFDNPDTEDIESIYKLIKSKAKKGNYQVNK